MNYDSTYIIAVHRHSSNNRIDSVLSYRIEDPEFLNRMNVYWF